MKMWIPSKMKFWISFLTLFITVVSIFLCGGWWETMKLEMLKDSEIIDQKYYYRKDGKDSVSKNVVFIRSLKDTTRYREYYSGTSNSINIYAWHRHPIIYAPLNVSRIRKFDIVAYTPDSNFAIVRIGKLDIKNRQDNRSIIYIPTKYLHNSLP